jgi:hypothetical protein
MKKVILLTLWMLVLQVPVWVSLSFTEKQEQGCGIDRRDVKSLNDTDAKKISFTARRAEISDLILFAPPSKINSKTPRFGSEFYVYQINCTIREYRKEDDGDYHLVLQATGDTTTMVGEILNPECPDLKNSPHLQDYIKVRAEFEKYILPKNKVKSGYYKLKGVCFFDKPHGQLGCAKNAVELHPILSFIRLSK